MDELLRTFSYDEKPKVSEYYPQYYHKTDKVSTSMFYFNLFIYFFWGRGGGGEIVFIGRARHLFVDAKVKKTYSRMAGQYISSS